MDALLNLDVDLIKLCYEELGFHQEWSQEIKKYGFRVINIGEYLYDKEGVSFNVVTMYISSKRIKTDESIYKEGLLTFNRVIKRFQPEVVHIESEERNLLYDVSFNLRSLGYNISFVEANACIHTDLPIDKTMYYIVAYEKGNVGYIKPFNESKKHLKIEEIIDVEEEVPKKYILAKDSKEYREIISSKTVSVMYVPTGKKSLYKSSNICPSYLTEGCIKKGLPVINSAYGLRYLTIKEYYLLHGYPFNIEFPDESIKKLYTSSLCLMAIGPITKKIIKRSIGVMKKNSMVFKNINM